MMERLKLDSSLLPEVKESADVTGAISKAAAKATGLKEGTPVVGGAGDQAASGIGNGIVKSGVASCTIGTSGVVFAATEKPALDRKGRIHTFCHAIPGRWHVMGVTQAAGLSLRWLRDQRPAWSPDGGRVVFASNRHAARDADAGDLDLYAVDMGSGAITRLTHDPAVADDPTYSPDGKRLFFTSTRDAARPYSVEIYVMPAAGGEQRRVTRDEFPENSAPAAGRVP